MSEHPSVFGFSAALEALREQQERPKAYIQINFHRPFPSRELAQAAFEVMQEFEATIRRNDNLKLYVRRAPKLVLVKDFVAGPEWYVSFRAAIGRNE